MRLLVDRLGKVEHSKRTEQPSSAWITRAYTLSSLFYVIIIIIIIIIIFNSCLFLRQNSVQRSRGNFNFLILELNKQSVRHPIRSRESLPTQMRSGAVIGVVRGRLQRPPLDVRVRPVQRSPIVLHTRSNQPADEVPFLVYGANEPALTRC